MIDSVQIRVPFSMASPSAPFVPSFSRRKFEDLSSIERTHFNQKAPYLRIFTLHPRNSHRSRKTVRVRVFEKLDRHGEKIRYEMVITISSLAKFLYANNLQEIAPSENERVFKELRSFLSSECILISEKSIADAQVSVAHFAKNVPLPSAIRAQSIIKLLAKTDIGKAFNTNDNLRIDETDGGRSLRLACGVKELAFYEKVQEMRAKTKKSPAGEQTDFERKLFDVYNIPEDIEVFRFEYRIKKTQTVQSEINPLLGRKYDTPVRFQDIFSETLWKQIINRAWRKLINRPDNQLALLGAGTKLDLWNHVLSKARKSGQTAHSQNQAFWCYGIAAAMMDHDVKSIRRSVEKVWSKRAADRFDEKIKTAAAMIEGMAPADGIAHITRALEQFAPLSLEALHKAYVDNR